jgi:hypothetical protein
MNRYSPLYKPVTQAIPIDTRPMKMDDINMKGVVNFKSYTSRPPLEPVQYYDLPSKQTKVEANLCSICGYPAQGYGQSFIHEFSAHI